MKTKILLIVILFVITESINQIIHVNAEEGNIERLPQISSRQQSSFVVKSDGTLWAWGDNRSGQMGDGTLKYRQPPVKIRKEK